MSIIVSIVAIFLSNFLGRWDSSRKYKKQQKIDRYNYLYVPFIKFIFNEKPIPLLLANIVGQNEFEDLDNLIRGNLKYLGKSSTDKYFKLLNVSVPAIENYFEDVQQMIKNNVVKPGDELQDDNQFYQACLLFNDFMLEVLQESVDIAKELELEPIGQTLLDVYSKQISSFKPRTLKEAKDT